MKLYIKIVEEAYLFVKRKMNEFDSTPFIFLELWVPLMAFMAKQVVASLGSPTCSKL